MKFYDRKKEMAILYAAKKQSQTSACFTVMTGRRRIGKTALLLESVKDTRFVYIFVARKSEVLLCAQYQPVIQETLGIRIYGEIREFAQLFELLMQHSQKENFTLIIDEFQEFLYINPSIVSDIQRIWDQYHATSKINFIVCGSVYSMMKRIFEDRKEPLYGRLTARISLHPFTTTVIKEILADHAPQFTSEDLLCLYLLTGGVAKYITLLMEAKAFNKTAMINYALSEGSPFLTEGKDMLISEVGKDYANYFSILSLIAEGKTTPVSYTHLTLPTIA